MELKADSLLNNGAQNTVVSEDLKKDSLNKEPSGKKIEKSELPHPTLQNSNNAATNRLQKAPMGADVKPGRGPSTRNPKGPRKKVEK